MKQAFPFWSTSLSSLVMHSRYKMRLRAKISFRTDESPCRDRLVISVLMISNVRSYHPGLVMGDYKYAEYSTEENCRVNE
jgi:hypothetical protein